MYCLKKPIMWILVTGVNQACEKSEARKLTELGNLILLNISVVLCFIPFLYCYTQVIQQLE